jgi:hypothetical protein
MEVSGIAPGYEVPHLQRRGNFATWTRYAAVNYEIADHHMDDEVARHEGFPAAFAMAPFTFALVQTMLRDWIGLDGRIVSVAISLRSPWLRGRMFSAGGTVTAVRPEGHETFVDLDVWADDDQGTRLVQGPATVAIATSTRT